VAELADAQDLKSDLSLSRPTLNFNFPSSCVKPSAMEFSGISPNV